MLIHNTIMKRIIIVLLCGCIALSLSAQNKKEMQAIVTDLQTAVTNLQTTIQALQTTINAQSMTIESLNSQLTDSKATIKDLQQSLKELSDKHAALEKQLSQQPGSGVFIPTTAQDSVAAFFVQFRALENWEDLVPYVMESERVKPAMQKYYAKKGYGAKQLEPAKVAGWTKKTKKNVYLIDDDIYVIKTADGYKVDWEASYLPKTFDLGAFLNTQSIGSTVTVWASVEIDTYYDNSYWNSYKIWSYSLERCYTEKNSTIDKKLKALCQDGEKKMVLKVKIEKASDGSKYLAPVEVVCDGYCKY